MQGNTSQILESININFEVLNIYPYGSHVYGNSTEKSDLDYIIVSKSSLLPDGSFKMNAISSKDRTIQGILYSRGGFKDALNNYEMNAHECISLPKELVIQEKLQFKVDRWDEKSLIKNVITKSSNSWFIADKQFSDGFIDRAKKGCYHALRILMFGLQLKEHKKIIDFTVSNQLKMDIAMLSDEEFHMKQFRNTFKRLTEKLK